MKKITLALSLILTATATFAATTEQDACESNGVNYSQAKMLASQLTTALENDDKETIANLIEYPLRINKSRSGKTLHYFITNKNEFEKQYASLFTDANKKSIIKDISLFCNYQGAMLGGGVVWLHSDDKSTKIFSLNP